MGNVRLGKAGPPLDDPGNTEPDNDAYGHMKPEIEPGTVIRSDVGLCIACGNGAIEIMEIQQEGKKRMDATDFVRGSSIQPGDVLV